ncbi:MAG: LPS export ABC transporter periplasmic protein LptC [Woeseiaceae bacterium]
MEKLRYITALLLIILLTIVVARIFKSIDESPTATKEKTHHTPDYFLKNFTSTTMDETGKPSYKVKAAYLEHFPDNDSMKLEYPLFSFYENNIKTWTVKADEALLFNKDEVIKLKGNVLLNKINTKDPTQLLSEQLTIELKLDRVHTKSKVEFRNGYNIIKAIGMKADIKNNKIEFLSNTRSHYVVQKK